MQGWSPTIRVRPDLPPPSCFLKSSSLLLSTDSITHQDQCILVLDYLPALSLLWGKKSTRLVKNLEHPPCKFLLGGKTALEEGMRWALPSVPAHSFHRQVRREGRKEGMNKIKEPSASSGSQEGAVGISGRAGTYEKAKSMFTWDLRKQAGWPACWLQGNGGSVPSPC